jgi:hemoglobin-like flavoprotein
MGNSAVSPSPSPQPGAADAASPGKQRCPATMNGSSRRNEDSPLASGKHQEDSDSLISSCLPGWLSGRNGPASPTTINSSRIISSWIKILSVTGEPSVPGGPVVSGIIVFQRTFFSVLKSEDPHDRVLNLLNMCTASSTKAHRTAESMLFVIVRFLVSVTDKTPETVNKLRSLGRFHQRRGIMREHVIIFKRVLYITITELLELKEDSPLLRDWVFLTEFAFNEMYKYNYSFSPRRYFSDVNDDSEFNTDSATLANESNNVNASRSSDHENSEYNSDEITVFSQQIVQLRRNNFVPIVEIGSDVDSAMDVNISSVSIGQHEDGGMLGATEVEKRGSQLNSTKGSERKMSSRDECEALSTDRSGKALKDGWRPTQGFDFEETAHAGLAPCLVSVRPEDRFLLENMFAEEFQLAKNTK